MDKTLKLLVFLSGTISVSTFSLSVLFKLMHWPGAVWLLIIGLGSFALAFIPLLAIFLYRKHRA